MTSLCLCFFFQMKAFRHKIKKTPVNDTHEENLIDDFRPLQQLNGRNVYSSFKIEKPATSAPPATARPIFICGQNHNNGGNFLSLSKLLILFFILINVLT